MEMIAPPATSSASSETFSNSNSRRLKINGLPAPWSTTTVFLAQVIVVYVVIIAAIVNLTFFPDGRQELWITLLSSGIGYLLHSPTIKKPSASKALSLIEAGGTNGR